MNRLRLLVIVALCSFLLPHCYGYTLSMDDIFLQGPAVDRHYQLEATMLGYFDENGTRNPVLKANKGDVVKITIRNGEDMTHDIVMEKSGARSEVILQKGTTTSVTFTAKENDTYFCSIPGHRAAGMEGRFEVVEGTIVEQVVVQGELPVVNGKKLNLDFESGTLADWDAKGEAFAKALVSEEPSPMHEKDMNIGKVGKYFLSSGGTVNHQATGTLTSVPFKVSHPYASFKVSGGALEDTRVELVSQDDQKVFFHITGSGRATLQPVVVDLKDQMGKEIFIRIIDNETGLSPIPYIKPDKWAHINFDDFQFHKERPAFPNELVQDDIITLPPIETTKFSGLSGVKAAEAMELPEGFSVTLAAAEPDVVRPIAFTIDYRGRLWVVEAHTYPVRAPEGQGRDRILILEDTDGDGRADKRKVFWDQAQKLTSVEIGFGGVWALCAPHLLFIPDADRDDQPDSDPIVVLDGWNC